MFSLKKLSAIVFSLVGTFALAQHNHHDSGQHVMISHENHTMSHHAAPAMKDSAIQVNISNCWGRFRGEHPSALYAQVQNKETTPAYVVGIKTDKFAKTMMHESYEKDGMAGMRHVGEVVIPAEGEVAFKPGSYHFMLFEPQHTKEGDKIDVAFVLSNGHEITTQCLMKSPKARTFED